MAEEWTVRLCESAFSRKKLFGQVYYKLHGVAPGHTFVQLCAPDGQPSQEIHAGALHVSQDSAQKKDWSPLKVLAETILPDSLAQHRIYAWTNTSEECTPQHKLAGSSIILSDSKSEIMRRWLSAMEIAARINTEERRYHFLSGNCNTLTRLMSSAMGVGIHSTVTGSFGSKGQLSGKPIDAFAEYFNLYSTYSLSQLEARHRELSEKIGEGMRAGKNKNKQHDHSDLILR